MRESDDVVVASVPTLGRAGSTLLSAAIDAKQYKCGTHRARRNDEGRCVIIDEAHHATAATYRRILDHLGVFSQAGVCAAARLTARQDSHVKLWGCSATVRRHDGVALGAVFDKARS